MLNEDDLRPGDVVQDAMGDFWHVHDDGKIWCSEPGARISFEHARSAGPFTYAPGCGPKRDTVKASEDDSVKHEGKWTRADLPRWDKIRDADDMAGNGLRSRVIDIALNEVVYHLNAHYPKPAPDLLSSAADCVLGAEDRVHSAKAERDAAVARAENAERELAEEKRQHSDTIQVTDEQYTALMRERDDAVRERCYWKARAEEAEADLEELAEEFADFRVEVVAEAVKYRESNPQASGDDPAVYVVRESDIAAVEIERDERGWHGPGTTWTERSTSGEVRAHAEGLVRNVARCEAVARAIEAEPTVDPIEEKAIAAFKVAWHEADMHGDEGNRTRRGIRAARKVIEGDRK